MLQLQSHKMSGQIQAVLKYQAVATLLLALVLVVLGGKHWGISALLGGLVSLIGGAIYGVLLARIRRGSAENALFGMMRAEMAKILVIVFLLWLVLARYEQIFGAGFIGTFIITTMIFSLAVFIRDK